MAGGNPGWVDRFLGLCTACANNGVYSDHARILIGHPGPGLIDPVSNSSVIFYGP